MEKAWEGHGQLVCEFWLGKGVRYSPFFSLGSMVVVWILCMQNISIADFFFITIRSMKMKVLIDLLLPKDRGIALRAAPLGWSASVPRASNVRYMLCGSALAPPWVAWNTWARFVVLGSSRTWTYVYILDLYSAKCRFLCLNSVFRSYLLKHQDSQTLATVFCTEQKAMLPVHYCCKFIVCRACWNPLG